MKKITFLLLFLPFTALSQTISISASDNNGTIDGFTFPKNTLSYSRTSATNIKLFVQSAGAVWGIHPYSDFTLNGVPFSSLNALTGWIDTNMFSASISIAQLDTMYLKVTTNIVTSDTLTVSNSGTYTFTDSSVKSWKMPSVSSAIGMTIFIINRGSAALTINSNAGGNDLDINGIYSSFIVVAPGENYVLRGNSLKLVSVTQ